MKKISLLLLLSFALLFAVSANAYDLKQGNYYFNILTATSVEDVGGVTTYHYNVEATSMEGNSSSSFRKTYSGIIEPPATFTVNNLEHAKAYIYTLTKIGDMAFANNFDATELVIPETVTEIGDMGLLGNPDLKKITCLAKTPPSHSGKFLMVTTQVANAATLYVPKGCKAAYQRATGWRAFPNIQEIEPSLGDHDFVDLGLPSGKLWSTCNYGATKPTDYGSYISWASHDPIPSDWGEYWRTPTRSEIKELIDNCTWTWTSQSGVNGYEAKGKNSNTIFIPAAGFKVLGYSQSVGNWALYWTSTPSNETGFEFTFSGTANSLEDNNTYNTSTITAPIRPIVVGVTNGIESIATTPQRGKTYIYNVNGMEQPSLRKGLNIIKSSDGTIKKVFIR